MAALEQQGRQTFLMQPGKPGPPALGTSDLRRQRHWVRGALRAALSPRGRVELPDHAAVLDFLRQEGVQAPSLALARLVRRAGSIAATACEFQRVLRRVRPRLAFVVTFYAGLGHAFALACRREGLICVDLQHCPQEGGHRAYRWSKPPEQGYSTLPAVFWTWSPEDAACIAAWADPSPWHAAIHGGHSQLTPYLDDQDAATRKWDERFGRIGDAAAFERDILVALQPIGGRRAVWEALARHIEAAPTAWRWWIRRHPSASLFQDSEYRRLLELQRPNVVIEEASALPLPTLLRRMSVLVSLASGAAAEAAAFGVPALSWIAKRSVRSRARSRAVRRRSSTVADVVSRIADMPRMPTRATLDPPPPIGETLRRLDGMAEAYGRLRLADPPECSAAQRRG